MSGTAQMFRRSVWVCAKCKGWNDPLSGQCWRCGNPNPAKDA